MTMHRGITGPRAERRLDAFMNVMLSVPTDEKLWEDATELAWWMDRIRQVMQASDLVIATCALRVGASVLTNDSDFRRVPSLSVIQLPELLR